jgi:hypothetical protein
MAHSDSMTCPSGPQNFNFATDINESFYAAINIIFSGTFLKLRSASYTWRNLSHGRDLLYEGVRWGIGGGKTVKITMDN